MQPTDTVNTENRRHGGLSLPVQLVLLSFLMLFVELLLIRWAAANVVYLAFFTNFVLLASFLGIGIGFLRRGMDPDPLRRAAVALAILLLLLFVFPVGVTLAEGGSLVGLFNGPALPIWLSLPLIFVAVVAVLTFIAEAVADVFALMKPLDAYRLDILGSLAGVSAFSLLSFLGASPAVWGLVVSGVIWAVRRPERLFERCAIGAVAVLFLVGSLISHASWSPYYKVTVAEPDSEGRIEIEVNGLPHQSIVPLAELEAEGAFYLDPYTHLDTTRLQNVLIVGAGNGNDVAVALAQGAQQIDAVEIDPVIQGIGRDLHPDEPYGDPRVRAVVDDGRAFLQRTDQRYDLILFALPDSLTVVSGQGSLRLESYLFTLEALREVRDHLKPDGAFAMYNYYRPDVFDRFAATIHLAFGHPPCIDVRAETLGPRQQAVLTVGRAADGIDCQGSVWEPASSPGSVATDNHPFPYLDGRTIPRFYLIALALLLLSSFLAVRVFGATPLRAIRPYLDLFLMGVAFLLLGTKNVVQFALLFGTTWFVNALVFAGILLSVYLAVEVARRRVLPRPSLLYLALGGSLVAAYLVPQADLLGLPPASRFVAAVTLAFTPVFLANLVFAQRFKDVARSTVAFGANLLGAMVGGVLEYAALITGYRALLFLVAGAYVAAFLLRPAAARA